MCLQPGEQFPEGFSEQVFGGLSDQPLCSLYAPRGTSGSNGPCETLPTQCSRNASWCDPSNPDSDAVEELIALQLTKVRLHHTCCESEHVKAVPVICPVGETGQQHFLGVVKIGIKSVSIGPVDTNFFQK